MKKLYILTAAVLTAGGFLCASAADAAPAPIKESIRKVTKRIDESQWKHIGTGKYADAALCNEFLGYYNDEVAVEMYESTTEPGVYYIDKPWVGEEVDKRPERNFMVVDARDPEFVRVREGIFPVRSSEDGDVHYMSMTENMVSLIKEKVLPDGTDEEILAKAKEIMNMNAPKKILKLEDGFITLPTNCFGVMYPDGANEQPGLWVSTNGSYSGYIALPGKEVQSDWEFRGVGRILEGFVAPVFDEPVEERDIQVYEHKQWPDLFRIEDAIHVSDGVYAPMVVDAADHNYVRIPEFDTRIVTGRGPLSILSVSAQSGYTDYDTMVGMDPANADRNITYSDGVIDIPRYSVLLVFPIEGLTAYTHEKQQRSFIVIPEKGGSGVEGVEISEELPAEYYDLQGCRVAEPAKGQLVIERRGGKARKVVIR